MQVWLLVHQVMVEKQANILLVLTLVKQMVSEEKSQLQSQRMLNLLQMLNVKDQMKLKQLEEQL